MDIENVKFMHEHYGQHMHIGTAKMIKDKNKQ